MITLFTGIVLITYLVWHGSLIFDMIKNKASFIDVGFQILMGTFALFLFSGIFITLLGNPA